MYSRRHDDNRKPAGTRIRKMKIGSSTNTQIIPDCTSPLQETVTLIKYAPLEALEIDVDGVPNSFSLYSGDW